MSNIPFQYIENLDNKIQSILDELSENIDSFNRDLRNYITRRQSKKRKPNKIEEKRSGECARETDENTDSENDCSPEFKKTDTSTEHLEKDISGNEINEKDVSGNEINEKNVSENISIEKDASGNIRNEKDVSGNISIEKDASGNIRNEKDYDNEKDLEKNSSQENDLPDTKSEKDHDNQDSENGNENEYTNKEEPSMKGCDQNKNNCGNKKKTGDASISFYKLPELKFGTNKKHIKKIYKKLIVKLHPDKVGRKNTTLFKEYYDQCREALKSECLYKMWIISKKINVKVKLTKKINKALIKELNILKQFTENLEKSIVYKWIHESCPNKKENYLVEYIKKNIIYL